MLFQTIRATPSLLKTFRAGFENHEIVPKHVFTPSCAFYVVTLVGPIDAAISSQNYLFMLCFVF